MPNYLSTMEPTDTILITGARGLVGSALADLLRARGYTNLRTPSHQECDYTDRQAVRRYFATHQPDYVFHLAGKVYGIMGNMQNKGLSFLHNILINTHVIDACQEFAVNKVVAMGTGCIYPCPSPGLPLKEDMVWMGEPHASENSYAHAKRAMLAQLNAYRESYDLKSAFVISCNLYGPHDKFDKEHGHVVPALVCKFHEAKLAGDKAIVWGDGSAQRDFLYVKDTARSLVHVMEHLEGPVNIGSGTVIRIRDIVEELTKLTGLEGRVEWDASKPNGQDYRAYDLSRLQSTGFTPEYDLAAGLAETWEWYNENVAVARH